MKRVYHQDDYKNMAVDLLCISSNPKVLVTLFSVGGGLLSYQALVRAAAVLTKIGCTIDPEPIIVEDSDFKESLFSKS